MQLAANIFHTGATVPPPGRRIAVVGTTGSGKTTLAQQLAARLELTHVELDALYWQADWTGSDTARFRTDATAALAGTAWVVDGNYSKVRDLIWPRADTVIWLDYPLPVVLWRLTGRMLRRTFTRQELWNGNRETLRGQIFSRDSLFLWALKTYQRRRREYPAQLALPEHAHLVGIRLRSPRETARWLAALPAEVQHA